ncbi:MAG: alpha/beta hydrolase [Sphingobacteriales bacterium]|nr:MAG: alpha/beta hydrolase [Sphingobacteriales bacterium]
MKSKMLTLFIILLFTNALLAQSQVRFDTLQVGAIKQVVSYTGNNNLPIILFLHGGPGSSRMKQAAVFSNILQKHFLVVQWDQRETGSTLALNKSSVPITLDVMEDDTYEVINLLLKKFKQKKLYLVGESWGTVLGFKMAQKHPELLKAYIAFSPVVNQSESEQILLDKLKLDAKEKGNDLEEKELSTVRIPYDNYQQVNYAKKWMLDYDGHPLPSEHLAAFANYIKDWSATWLPLWNKVLQQNLSVELPKIKCPVYFFLGEKDLQTNFSIANDYFKILKAPEKKLFSFKNAGHSVLTEEAERVQHIIIDEILKKAHP